jgi:hypothetical protein
MDRLSTIARLGAAAAMLVAAAIVSAQVDATGAPAAQPAYDGRHAVTPKAQAVPHGKQRSGVTPKDGYLRAGALMSSCGNMEMG